MRKSVAISTLCFLTWACATTPNPKQTHPATSETRTSTSSSAAHRAQEEHKIQAQKLAPVVDKIIKSILKSNNAWEKLVELCDDIGHRLSGSKALERAIDWAVQVMLKDQHNNVKKEPVQVVHWTRGIETAELLSPRVESLPILGLGGSVGTPASGITADVVVVENEQELNALGTKAVGKIVLFNNRMPDYHPEHGSGYGKTVRFRVHGARLASEKGAVGVLIRSVTAHSLRSPHTGVMRYGAAKKKIPAAALSTEDADLIARFYERGQKVQVRLTMQANTAPDTALSHNVIAELPGREAPEEIVVIGGHIDSWDAGQGAHDDGAGCVIAMEALSALRKLNLIPRRTIRVVLWTNEENGLAGAKAYAKAHASELEQHFAAIESDSGAFKPIGFGLDLKDNDAEKEVAKNLEIYAQLLNQLRPQRIWTGFGGADVGPLRAQGVPAMGLRVEGSKYFNYHHSHADTLDKVDPQELSEGVAAMAAMAYILAEIPSRIDTR
ncbi:MAG: M20/M25/M40 family metallo-hydrolase [Myxococcota bacterium]|nr:M20/M25/M40 family metallo-hydrolase [Myxococcota bacterium]